MKPRDTDWRAHEIDLLEQNWQYKSATQIGVMLGKSRNAICGMVHRLQEKGRLAAGPAKQYVIKPWPEAAKKPRKPRPVRVLAMKPAHTPAPPGGGPGGAAGPPDAPAPLTLVELEDHHCRWPLGDPRSDDFAFCARARVAGMPYCSGHCSIAFNHQGKAA